MEHYQRVKQQLGVTQNSKKKDAALTWVPYAAQKVIAESQHGIAKKRRQASRTNIINEVNQLPSTPRTSTSNANQDSALKQTDHQEQQQQQQQQQQQEEEQQRQQEHDDEEKECLIEPSTDLPVVTSIESTDTLSSPNAVAVDVLQSTGEFSISHSFEEEEKQQLSQADEEHSSDILFTSARLQRLAAKKQAAHEAALQQHLIWSTEDDNHRQSLIHNICQQAQEQRTTTQEQLNALIHTSSDEQQLVTMSIQAYNTHTQSIQTLLTERKSVITSLEQQLLQVESERQQHHVHALHTLIPTLLQIAHMLPAGIHTVLTPITDALNTHLIQNHHYIKDLIHRLTVEEDAIYSSTITTVEQQTLSWKQLRHSSVLSAFHALLASPLYETPDDRHQCIQQLYQVHESYLSTSHLHIETLFTSDARWMTMDKIIAIERELHKKSTRLVRDRERVMKKLHKTEDERLVSIHAELETVKAELASYAAYDEQQLQSLIQTECIERIEQSHERVIALFTQTVTASDAQLAQWNRKVASLLLFFKQACQTHLSYTSSLNTFSASLTDQLSTMQQQHHKQLNELESQLSEQIMMMRHSPSIELLDQKKEIVMQIVGEDGSIAAAYKSYPQQLSAFLSNSVTSLESISADASHQMCALVAMQSEEEKHKAAATAAAAAGAETKRSEDADGSITNRTKKSSAASTKSAKGKKGDKEDEDKKREEEERKKEAEEKERQLRLESRCVFSFNPPKSITNDLASVHTETPSQTQIDENAAPIAAEASQQLPEVLLSDDDRVFYKMMTDEALLQQLVNDSFIKIDMRSAAEREQAQKELQEKQQQQVSARAAGSTCSATVITRTSCS